MNIDKDIDVVGRACPLPLIALAKEVRRMKQGQIVRITGNDPVFEASVVDFCEQRGHTVVETTRSGKTVTMILSV